MTIGRCVGALIAATILSAPALAQPRVTGRVSVGTGGSELDGHSAAPDVSADGRYVTFLSEAASLDGCFGSPGTVWGLGVAQVYLRDRQTGQTECISKASDGTAGNARSGPSAVSAVGDVVVFLSRATNLVSPATAPLRHVFARSRADGVTKLVSVATGGAAADADSDTPRVSDDGRFVVFASRASNLIAGGTSPNRSHVYIRDLRDETTTLVDLPEGGVGEPDGHATSPSITPDARFIAFASNAGNLTAAADTNGAVSDVFLRDMASTSVMLLSVSTGGEQSDGPSTSPFISANGKVVAFASGASNLVPGVLDGWAHVFVRDLASSATTALPVGTAVVPDSRFPHPTSLSGDGRFVAFQALTAPYTVGGAPGHFLHDRALHSTIFIAGGSGGNSFDPLPGGPVLTRNGREMMIDSLSSTLIPIDTNFRMDVFSVCVPHYAVDVGIYRASSGDWLISQVFDGTVDTKAWGSPALHDVPVFADYDADGRSDAAVYRPSTGEWFIDYSSGGARTVQWGSPANQDQPVPADFDGDGKADIAVYRKTSGRWLILLSGGGTRIVDWGAPSLDDVPLPADYSGDGRAEVAVFRRSTGQWFIAWPTGSAPPIDWGAPSLGDVPIPGDYDGDGDADVAVYRATTGEWFIRLSPTVVVHDTFGAPSLGDVPLPADYDGDGVTDQAVRRPSTGEWFIFHSATQSLRAVTWGSDALGDVPLTLPIALR
jgi:Tol biopolymer transport system component